MEGVPGVEAAAVVSHLPLRATRRGEFELEGVDVGRLQDPLTAEIRTVSSGYFELMGIEVTGGRAPTTADDLEATQVVVINQALADAYSAGINPVGRRIRLGSGPWRDVVGVVTNVRHDALDTGPRPTIYTSYRQGVGRSMTFVLRTAGPPEAMAPAATEALRRVDADLPVYAVASMATVLGDTLAQRRILMLLLSLFAVQAMLLASIGVYGVIAYATRQRRREIGIRLALGANRGTVIGLILRQGAVLGVMGVGAGLIGAAGMTRLLRSFLFEVGHLDPAVFGGMALPGWPWRGSRRSSPRGAGRVCIRPRR